MKKIVSVVLISALCNQCMYAMDGKNSPHVGIQVGCCNWAGLAAGLGAIHEDHASRPIIVRREAKEENEQSRTPELIRMASSLAAGLVEIRQNRVLAPAALEVQIPNLASVAATPEHRSEEDEWDFSIALDLDESGSDWVTVGGEKKE